MYDWNSYPLCNIVKEGISWHWSLEHSKALKKIQTIPTAEMVQSFFNTKCPIEIQYASSHGLGLSLMQNKQLISQTVKSSY